MTESDQQLQPATDLHWDSGTGYELFISLMVLHQPEMYGLRPSWAAGIRSRIPAPERKILEDVLTFLSIPIHWLRSLPGEKDAQSVLWALRQIPAAERMQLIFSTHEWDEPKADILREIAAKHSWDTNDLKAVQSLLCHSGESERGIEQVTKLLNLWINQEQLGEAYYTALQTFYQVFFMEEEKRIAPLLQTGLQNARELSQTMGLQDLLTELSQGVHVQAELDGEMVLIPAYWSTPLLIQSEIVQDGKTTHFFIFGVRPNNMSIIPGEIVPGGLLRALKALADPTRLKILRYLSKEQLLPSELSRRLHLRAPTVTHHLAELRLAGLVNLELSGHQERRYTARREALMSMLTGLEDFLDGTSDGLLISPEAEPEEN